VVSDPPATLERFLLSLDRRRKLVGHEALIGAALQKLGASLERLPIGEAQRPLVLGGGFAVRP